MDPFEKIVKENRDSFDRKETNPKMWEKIKDNLNETQQVATTSRYGLFFLLKFAVAAAVLIVALFYFSPNDSQEKVFAEISMESPQGVLTPLDPSQNKYTLVNFWASGNVLCSEINCYYYLPAYNKYKDQGFEIYAVSLDENKEEWIMGIEENELPWIHVSDLQGWNSPVCIECEISKVPSSYLIDQNGGVIARDLDAKYLEETLERLFAVK